MTFFLNFIKFSSYFDDISDDDIFVNNKPGKLFVSDLFNITTPKSITNTINMILLDKLKLSSLSKHQILLF